MATASLLLSGGTQLRRPRRLRPVIDTMHTADGPCSIFELLWLRRCLLVWLLLLCWLLWLLLWLLLCLLLWLWLLVRLLLRLLCSGCCSTCCCACCGCHCGGCCVLSGCWSGCCCSGCCYGCCCFCRGMVELLEATPFAFCHTYIPSDIDQVLATLTADVASVQMHADESGHSPCQVDA